MASIIDPITGLPYDALDTTLYSIPLDSQPALAPEWNPQGRISSTVYPDNIPTVFATAQAQNSTNPQLPQALTTDGKGNLNVNNVGGGGGGGGPTPQVMQDFPISVQAFTSGPSHEVSPIGPIGDILYGFSASVAWSEAMGSTYNGGIFTLYLKNETTNDIVILCNGQINDKSVSGATHSDPFNQTIMFPVPRDITAFVAGDPTNLYVWIDNTDNLLEIQVCLFTS